PDLVRRRTMNRRFVTKILTGSGLLIALIAITALIAGCEPTPPVSFQPLQVQDSEEAQGYDIYLYIAVPKTIKGKEITDDQIKELLKWFDEVKYPSVNKIRIFVWDNPQSALINATGDMVGSLNIDREKKIFELRVRGKLP
ncbi:MAG: hypothetical protein ABIC40_01510, partial [bacterium]